MTAEPNPAPRIARDLFRIAWWAVGIAIAIELVLVALGRVPGLNAFIADLAGKVSWSLIVCAGLVVARGAAQGSAAAMGVAGLLAAPLAFTSARALHKSAAAALGLDVPGGPFPLAITLLKALEYACLGLLLAWFAKRAIDSAKVYAGTGLGIGAVFGGTMLAIQSPASAAAAAGTAVNELLFPVGCSLAIYATDKFAKKQSAPAVASLAQ